MTSYVIGYVFGFGAAYLIWGWRGRARGYVHADEMDTDR